ncbi:hypothetical protein B484DRAFT_453500, partial [Ochromonadaceae sp. CCMP2298]
LGEVNSTLYALAVLQGGELAAALGRGADLQADFQALRHTLNETEAGALEAKAALALLRETVRDRFDATSASAAAAGQFLAQQSESLKTLNSSLLRVGKMQTAQEAGATSIGVQVAQMDAKLSQLAETNRAQAAQAGALNDTQLAQRQILANVSAEFAAQHSARLEVLGSLLTLNTSVVTLNDSLVTLSTSVVTLQEQFVSEILHTRRGAETALGVVNESVVTLDTSMVILTSQQQNHSTDISSLLVALGALNISHHDTRVLAQQLRLEGATAANVSAESALWREQLRLLNDSVLASALASEASLSGLKDSVAEQWAATEEYINAEVGLLLSEAAVSEKILLGALSSVNKTLSEDLGSVNRSLAGALTEVGALRLEAAANLTAATATSAAAIVAAATEAGTVAEALAAAAVAGEAAVRAEALYALNETLRGVDAETGVLGAAVIAVGVEVAAVEAAVEGEREARRAQDEALRGAIAIVAAQMGAVNVSVGNLSTELAALPGVRGEIAVLAAAANATAHSLEKVGALGTGTQAKVLSLDEGLAGTVGAVVGVGFRLDELNTTVERVQVHMRGLVEGAEATRDRDVEVEGRVRGLELGVAGVGAAAWANLTALHGAMQAEIQVKGANIADAVLGTLRTEAVAAAAVQERGAKEVQTEMQRVHVELQGLLGQLGVLGVAVAAGDLGAISQQGEIDDLGRESATHAQQIAAAVAVGDVLKDRTESLGAETAATLSRVGVAEQAQAAAGATLQILRTHWETAAAQMQNMTATTLPALYAQVGAAQAHISLLQGQLQAHTDGASAGVRDVAAVTANVRELQTGHGWAATQLEQVQSRLLELQGKVVEGEKEKKREKEEREKEREREKEEREKWERENEKDREKDKEEREKEMEVGGSFKQRLQVVEAARDQLAHELSREALKSAQLEKQLAEVLSRLSLLEERGADRGRELSLLHEEDRRLAGMVRESAPITSVDSLRALLFEVQGGMIAHAAKVLELLLGCGDKDLGVVGGRGGRQVRPTSCVVAEADVVAGVEAGAGAEAET